MFILYSKYGHLYVVLLPLLFSNSNHSTLLEIHSNESTSQYGGRDNISCRQTRYGLTVRGSSPGGVRYPVFVRTDHKILVLFFKRWRPWCIHSFSAVGRDWIVMSRFFEVEAFDSSRFHWCPWRHLSRLPELFGCMLANVKHSTWERWHVNPP